MASRTCRTKAVASSFLPGAHTIANCWWSLQWSVCVPRGSSRSLSTTDAGCCTRPPTARTRGARPVAAKPRRCGRVQRAIRRPTAFAAPSLGVPAPRASQPSSPLGRHCRRSCSRKNWAAATRESKLTREHRRRRREGMKIEIACATLLIITAWTSRSTAQTIETATDCEAVRCDVQSAIAQCSEQTAAANPGETKGKGGMNHGQYVRCVAHVLRGLDIPHECTGTVMRCATRSTFGKPNFQTCNVQKPGKCDTSTTPSTCKKGTLAPGLTSCATGGDCVVTRCQTMRAFARHATPMPGEDRCSLLNATGISAVPGTGSCCPPCP